MNRPRIVVIGAGHLGRIHCRLARQGELFELVAVCDPVVAACESVAAENKTVAVADYHDILDHVDAAIVAAPTRFHDRITVDLLRHGIDVFVEKPLSNHIRSAEDLVDLAERKKCILQVGHVERFNPAWTAARARIQSPRIIQSHRTCAHSFRSVDIGVVHDLMIHDLDLVMSLVDSEVLRVDAEGTTVIGPQEDIAMARVEFADGCVAHLHASRIDSQPRRTMQILAPSQDVQIDFSMPSATVVGRRADLGSSFDPEILSPTQRQYCQQHLFDELLPTETLSIEPRNAIADEQLDFYESILSRRAPRVSGESALQALAVADRILASIAFKSRRVPTTPATIPSDDSHRQHRRAG